MRSLLFKHLPRALANSRRHTTRGFSTHRPHAAGSNRVWWAGTSAAVVTGVVTYHLCQSEQSHSRCEPEKRRSCSQDSAKGEVFHQYVVIGSGTTASAAIESIRQTDPTAEIVMVIDGQQMQRLDISGHSHASPDPSKVENVYNEWRRHVQNKMEVYENQETQDDKVSILSTRSGYSLDVERKRIIFPDGTRIRYGACLLAATGKPREFYVLDSTKMSYYLRGCINTVKSLNDFKELERIASLEGSKHITVVGGGFLGTELALALADIGQRDGTGSLSLSHVFVESDPLERHVPQYLAKHISARMEQLGIKAYPRRVVTSVQDSYADAAVVKVDESIGDRHLQVNLMGKEKEHLTTDYVVLASTHVQTGVRNFIHPNVEVDDETSGIVVNASLEAYDGFFVAGSIASFYDPVLGRRRVDTYDHAVNSGILAGYNMASSMRHKDGKPPGPHTRRKTIKSYRHQPVFHSSLSGIDLLLEGVGIIDSKLETVGVWFANHDNSPDAEEYSRGVVYYLKGNRVVGILCCNASECIGMARDVLSEQEPVSDKQLLKQRIQLAPEHWLKLVVTKPH